MRIMSRYYTDEHVHVHPIIKVDQIVLKLSSTAYFIHYNIHSR